MNIAPTITQAAPPMPTFGDREHVWGFHMPMEDQAKCWCEPLVHPIDTPWLGGWVVHRPEFGHVLWEHGEQGPMTARQMNFERSAP
jgi:hypothetical protein